MRILPRLRPLLLATVLALSGAGAASAQTTPEACNPTPVDEVASSMVNGSQKHLALFDVYWDYDDDANDPDSKTLINNPCPPLVVHHPGEDDGFGNVTPETTTRDPSDIDIGHTIIHIPSSELQREAEGDTSAVLSFKRTVTADGTGDYDGADYAFLRPLQKDGTRADSAEVWVVPSCEEEEERGPHDPGPTALDPPLCLGFSAGLLQAGDWNGDIQYEFEAIREPGHATTGYGDFFVFHVENGEPEIKWRTDEADTNAYHITPGTYDHAYWAFTEPGTYVFHVQVKGRPNRNRTGGPLIKATTVTSEVRRYTFHVGDLAVNHDPVFEVERSVSENATGGTHVGAPIIVHDLDATTLCFALTGHGAQNFTLEGTTGTDECGTLTAVTENADGQIGAQIIVRERSYLDYETTPAYDLRLQVTDGQDPESNLDPSIDDSIAVRLALIDGPEHVRGSALALHAPASATVGESITLSASFVGGWPAPPEDITFRWHRRVAGGVAETGPTTIGVAQHTETFDRSGSVEYSVAAHWWEGHSERLRQSPWITVHWQ